MEAPASCGADAGLEEWDLKRTCARYLTEVTEKERLILAMRFGLTGDDPWTLQRLGDALGVTRERIRQLESKALGRIRSRAQQVCAEATTQQQSAQARPRHRSREPLRPLAVARGVAVIRASDEAIVGEDLRGRLAISRGEFDLLKARLAKHPNIDVSPDERGLVFRYVDSPGSAGHAARNRIHASARPSVRSLLAFVDKVFNLLENQEGPVLVSDVLRQASCPSELWPRVKKYLLVFDAIRVSENADGGTVEWCQPVERARNDASPT